MARAQLGQMLKDAGLVGEVQIASALAYQRKWGCRIGESMLRLRLVDPDQLLAVAGRQLGLPVVYIGDRAVPRQVVRRLPERLILARRVFPLELVRTSFGQRLVVAFAAPDDLTVVDEVRFAAGLPVDPVLATAEDIARAAARHGIGAPLPARVEAVELPPEPLEPLVLLRGA